MIVRLGAPTTLLAGGSLRRLCALAFFATIVFTTMGNDDNDKPSAGMDDRFGDAIQDCLEDDDFAEALRAKLLEQELRVKMLGAPPEPVLLGRWEVRQAVDQGAMGAVFRAFDPRLNREVAIKLLLSPGGTDHDERRKRMATEARAMAHLVPHANVIQIHDFQEGSSSTEGSPTPSFLVMDFVRGDTLLRWQREERRSWREVVEKYAQAARGLAHIHDARLVHRDVKPANILVRHDGVVLVGDFGLVHGSDRPPCGDTNGELEATLEYRNDAVIAGPFATRHTREGALIGTLAYMAPEQLRDGQTSAKSDQFSFFASLYQALYGHLPFSGTSPADLLQAMRRGPASRPRGPREEPRWLWKILAKGLSFAPESRYDNMEIVARALEDGLKPRTRNVPALVATGAIALALGGVAAIYLTSGEDPCLGATSLPAWSSPRRVLAHVGFLFTEVEGAEAAWTRFASATDRFADSWRGLKSVTCSELRRDRSPEVLALARARETCLDESALLLRAFVTRYRNAQVNDVTYSENAAFELHEALRACTNDLRLSRVLAESPSAEEDAEIQNGREQLANALALELGGDISGALAAASDALGVAQDLGHEGLRARASFRLGRLLSLQREEERALGYLSEALDRANATNRDDVAADAIIELVKLLTLDLEDLAQARFYARHVDSFVSRVSGDEPRRRAAALEAKGLLARASRENATAIRLLSEALDVRLATVGTPTAELIRSHLNLANALSDLESDETALNEATVHYEEANKLAQRISKEHPLLVDVLRTYGAFLLQRGELSEGEAREQAALSLAVKLYGDPSPQAAAIHVHLGAIALTGDRWEAARSHVEAALAHYERVSRVGAVDTDHISALHLLAEIERNDDADEGAVGTLYRALELLRESPDHRLLEADTRGYLGELLVDLGRDAEALPHLQAAWEVLGASEARSADHPFLLAALAVAEAASGDTKSAMHSAREALSLAGDFDLADDPDLRARIESVLGSTVPKLTTR